MSVCSRYNHNKEDAEAILNLSFLKILLGLSKYKKEIPFKLWVRKVTINTVIDEFRKNKKMKEATMNVDFQNDYEIKDYYVVNEYINKADADAIYKLIKVLPEMPQKVFNLFVVDGFEHSEIAKMLNIPSGTSRWYLSLAKEELKKQIQKKKSPIFKKVAS